MGRTFSRLGLATLAAAVMVQPALAHPGHVGHHGFMDGVTHPLGWDHLLAMVAVGLLAVRFGGKALWIMPAAFLGSMIGGGLLFHFGVPLPQVENGILASVLVLGLLVVLSSKVPMAVGAVLVGVFALFHGYAHISEGEIGTYAAGFLLSTALLHAAGIVLGVALGKLVDNRAVQVAGGAIAAASLLMMVGLL